MNRLAMVTCYVIIASSSFSEPPSTDLSAPIGNIDTATILKHFESYDVVLKPDQDEPEWWAGAPSVAVGVDGVFWMACRMRTADSERGLRGYEIRILRSEDGVTFTKAHSILREEVPIPGSDRPALLRDSKTGAFKLYGCGPWQGGPWGIYKFEDATSPDKFVADSAQMCRKTCSDRSTV